MNPLCSGDKVSNLYQEQKSKTGVPFAPEGGPMSS